MEKIGEMTSTWLRSIRKERAVVVVTWATALLLALPLAWTSIPPLSGYPNHLARVHLLGQLAEGAAVGPWSARWSLIPNLAIDVVGVALEPLLGLEGFGRAFIAATILLHVLGCQALSRAILGRVSFRAVVASALVWSEPLLLGYANFAFGFALALHALAGVVRLVERDEDADRNGRERSTGRDAVLAALLGLAVAASHAAAAATLSAAACAFVAARWWRDGRLRSGSRLALVSLVPLVGYVGVWWLRSASRGGITLATPGMIARAVLSPMTSLDARVDQASLVAAALLAAFALYRARPLALASWVRSGPFVATIALGLLIAVFPSDVAGGIEVHGRFALGMWTLAMFAFDRRVGAGDPQRRGSDRDTRPEAQAVVPRRFDFVAGATIALFAARTAVLATSLREVDHEARDIRALFARVVPEGAAVGVVWFFPADDLPSADRVRALATLHVPTLAIVDRHAEVPTLYDLPGAQPIHYDGMLPRRHRYAASDPGPRALDLLFVFEMVWLCGGPPDLAFELSGRATVVGRVGRCSLYRRNPVADIASSAASIAVSSSATSSSAASCSAASLPRTVVSSMRASTRWSTSAMRTPSFDAGSTRRCASTSATRATAGESDAASAASAPFSLSLTRPSASFSLPSGVSLARRGRVRTIAPIAASTATPSAPCTAGLSSRPTAGA